MQPIIAPSILSADFGRINEAIEMINNSQADWVHCDVMDGRFVPNITFGFPLLKAIKKVSKKPLDVHLMIVEPEKYIADFRKAGADILSVHVEASPHLHRTIHSIKENGMKAGVAVNPHTSVQQLADIIAEVDLVCLMSVNPGFGGQKFITNTYKKIAELKALIHAHGSSALIEVDGGVDMNNAARLMETGAQVLVAGNTVFNSSNPVETIAALKNSAKHTTAV